MSDISLKWDAQQGAADLETVGNDLAVDEGLETAVMLSLFTDRRASASDALPDSQTDRRGWWADAVPTVEGDLFGSRLWLLAREKRTTDVLARAEEYAREALAWMIEDRLTNQIDVSAEIVEPGVLGLEIDIYRPNADKANFRFTYNWAAQARA